MTTSSSTGVLVAGGGPVGLTLAIALGRRGVRCTVVESKASHAFLPKMELLQRAVDGDLRGGSGWPTPSAGPGTPSTRRWTCSSPPRSTTTPIHRMPYPSTSAMEARIAATHDGTEPRVCVPTDLAVHVGAAPARSAAATPESWSPSGSGARLDRFTQAPTGVDAEIVDATERSTPIRADYLVGCDGGASTVRQQLAIDLEGRSAVSRMLHVFFRCDDLLDRHPLGRGASLQHRG